MAEMNVSIKVTDLEQFNLFKKAAPAWLEMVAHPDYQASQTEKDLFGAIMSLAENSPSHTREGQG
jgi:hypothetical protein